MRLGLYLIISGHAARANVQICIFVNVQICDSANVQICECACKFVNLQVYMGISEKTEWPQLFRHPQPSLQQSHH